VSAVTLAVESSRRNNVEVTCPARTNIDSNLAGTPATYSGQWPSGASSCSIFELRHKSTWDNVEMISDNMGAPVSVSRDTQACIA
jgi:hypothetical protein